jgi:histidine triad (HIT) family protein
MTCLFCQILAGELPASIVYEDEQFIAFNDVNPQAPTHQLIIPRLHIETINDLLPQHNALVGEMFQVAKELAKKAGIDAKGYRTVMNCNAGAGQTVFHLHLHLLGGRAMSWPPG